ncbi:MAG TPA: Ig-like domain-containing protein [Nocardioides sp.]|nr:Ig-like domain-containing protein [Nocardioides sp.]
MGLSWPAPVAQAEPLPAPYAGNTDNEILGLDIGLFGFSFTDVGLAHTDTTVDSQADPPSSARASNLAAAVGGLGVGVSESTETAPPDNGGPTTLGLTEVDVTGLLDTGIITGTSDAHWAGDATCLPDGTAISSSTVELASAVLGNATVEVLDLGTSTTTGSTALVSNGGTGDARSVESTSTGTISSLTLLNDAVQVLIGGSPTLTATASGEPGGATVTYDRPTVQVVALGTTTTLQVGVATTISIPLVGSVTLQLGTPTVTTTADGQNAVGDVSLLTIDVTLLGGLGTTSIEVLPLHAEAHAPAGGVQCGLLDAPAITSPTDGSTTTDTTPAITGTGVPGATITVSEGGTVLGTTTVAPDGTWSLTPAVPLAPGAHTISATQVLGDATSAPSPEVTFTVVDETPPDAPVIQSPADGSVTGDSTPTISGTGEPGATVEVVVDGVVIGTTTVAVDGTWSLTPTTPLADGPHTVTATQTDLGGNTSPADSNTFTVDTTVPAAPVITGPADGSVVGDSTPTITGTGEPGATVEVVVDGVVIGTTTVDPLGNWTIDVAVPLADGPHTVTATQTDPAGNTSPVATSDFVVDTTAAPPVIDPALDGLLTNDDTPTISGTGEPGATVTVTTGTGQVLGSAVVAEDGTWSFDAVPMADGTHTLTAVQVDAVGNTSAPSAPVTITIDATIAPPVIDPVAEPVTSDTTPTVTGTAEPGATVVVSVDGVVVGQTTADGTGSWSFPLPAQEDGPHEVTATQTDLAGNASGPSEPVTITVDTVAPDAPTIAAPADGSVTSNPQPLVTGTAEPNTTVDVILDGATYTVAVGADGVWEVTPLAPLPDGTYTVSVTATDDAGNTSAPTTSTFEVDTTAPDAPLITGPADGSTIGTDLPTITGTAEPGSTVTVVVDGTPYETTADPVTGAWSVTVTVPLDDGPVDVTATATDDAGNTGPAAASSFVVDTTAAAPVITSPATGTVTNDATIPLTGTGEPGATVTVRDENGDVVATAVVDGLGNWTAETIALAEGVHTLTATQVDGLGNTSPASSPVQVTVDLTAAPPVVDPLPDGGLTSDATPTITGTGEPGATVEVSIDGVVVGTTTVGEDGTWSFTPTDPLADGSHTVTATQTDGAGNTSAVSEPVTIVVDTTAPAAPEITSVADGDVLDDPTPTISGTGEPGATVEVSIDGVVVGTAEVAADGTWSVDVTSPLADGPHTVEATQTDDAGNTSAPTAVDVVVDTPVPPAPTVEAPATTDDRTPTISGTGVPGSTVQVLLDGAVMGLAEVGPDGTWTFTFDDPLSCGTHEVSAVQLDTAQRRTLRSAAAPVQQITVLCAAGGGTGTGTGFLPDTGAAAGLTGGALLGALLVAGGVVLLRRRA